MTDLILPHKWKSLFARIVKEKGANVVDYSRAVAQAVSGYLPATVAWV
jgi:hypothetical protein